MCSILESDPLLLQPLAGPYFFLTRDTEVFYPLFSMFIVFIFHKAFLFSLGFFVFLPVLLFFVVILVSNLNVKVPLDKPLLSSSSPFIISLLTTKFS